MAETVESALVSADTQRRLERLVRENRVTIAVVFPLVGAVLLVASAEGVAGPVAFNPLLLLAGTLVMRSPLIVGLLPRIDRRAALALAALSIYAYGIEFVGVRTDWPYGAFEYGIDLGPMLLGEVPLGLPVFFVPLVVNGYLLTLLLLSGRGPSTARLLVGALAAVLAIDLVLDPAAVSIGFWAYEPPGSYYGVPVSNYRGWLLSGAVGIVLVDIGFDREALEERARDCEFVLDDLVSFVLLWGGVNVLYANWLAVGVAVVLGVALLATDRYDVERMRAAVSRSRDVGRS